MAVCIVLWPYLLTTKLRSLIRHNLGHSTDGAPDPFHLAYIALVEAGLFVLEDSNIMDVLV